VHVTCRIIEGLPSLRNPAIVAMLFNYLLRGCEREGFRIVEFSVQGNHIHMLCEADSKEALSRAMNGILCGMARQLNKHWGRKGKVFADRYHAETITTPTHCRHALIYVLANVFKHGGRAEGPKIDTFSTAAWFPFDDQQHEHPLKQRRKPAAEPKTWLLRTGWRKAGLITRLHHPRKNPQRKPKPDARGPAKRPQQKQKPDARTPAKNPLHAALRP